MTLIFIDGSYFCFYRYFALLTWWKNAFPEDPIIGDPADNPFFVDKFKKICQSRTCQENFPLAFRRFDFGCRSVAGFEPGGPRPVPHRHRTDW